jgi:hypothetical protein
VYQGGWSLQLHRVVVGAWPSGRAGRLGKQCRSGEFDRLVSTAVYASRFIVVSLTG